MSTLPAFFKDKEAQKDWADFIMEELNAETIKRVYAGKDVSGLKEAKDIISASFKKLNELFTEKKPRKATTRGE
jgi:hypothetical protein